MIGTKERGRDDSVIKVGMHKETNKNHRFSSTDQDLITSFSKINHPTSQIQKPDESKTDLAIKKLSDLE